MANPFDTMTSLANQKYNLEQRKASREVDAHANLVNSISSGISTVANATINAVDNAFTQKTKTEVDAETYTVATDLDNITNDVAKQIGTDAIKDVNDFNNMINSRFQEYFDNHASTHSARFNEMFASTASTLRAKAMSNATILCGQKFADIANNNLQTLYGQVIDGSIPEEILQKYAVFESSTDAKGKTSWSVKNSEYVDDTFKAIIPDNLEMTEDAVEYYTSLNILYNETKTAQDGVSALNILNNRGSLALTLIKEDKAKEQEDWVRSKNNFGVSIIEPIGLISTDETNPLTGEKFTQNQVDEINAYIESSFNSAKAKYEEELNKMMETEEFANYINDIVNSDERILSSNPKNGNQMTVAKMFEEYGIPKWHLKYNSDAIINLTNIATSNAKINDFLEGYNDGKLSDAGSSELKSLLDRGDEYREAFEEGIKNGYGYDDARAYADKKLQLDNAQKSSSNVTNSVYNTVLVSQKDYFTAQQSMGEQSGVEVPEEKLFFNNAFEIANEIAVEVLGLTGEEAESYNLYDEISKGEEQSELGKLKQAIRFITTKANEKGALADYSTVFNQIELQAKSEIWNHVNSLANEHNTEYGDSLSVSTITKELKYEIGKDYSELNSEGVLRSTVSEAGILNSYKVRIAKGDKVAIREAKYDTSLSQKDYESLINFSSNIPEQIKSVMGEFSDYITSGQITSIFNQYGISGDSRLQNRVKTLIENTIVDESTAIALLNGSVSMEQLVSDATANVCRSYAESFLNNDTSFQVFDTKIKDNQIVSVNLSKDVINEINKTIDVQNDVDYQNLGILDGAYNYFDNTRITSSPFKEQMFGAELITEDNIENREEKLLYEAVRALGFGGTPEYSDNYTASLYNWVNTTSNPSATMKTIIMMAQAINTIGNARNELSKISYETGLSIEPQYYDKDGNGIYSDTAMAVLTTSTTGEASYKLYMLNDKNEYFDTGIDIAKDLSPKGLTNMLMSNVDEITKLKELSSASWLIENTKEEYDKNKEENGELIAQKMLNSSYFTLYSLMENALKNSDEYKKTYAIFESMGISMPEVDMKIYLSTNSWAGHERISSDDVMVSLKPNYGNKGSLRVVRQYDLSSESYGGIIVKYDDEGNKIISYGDKPYSKQFEVDGLTEKQIVDVENYLDIVDALGKNSGLLHNLALNNSFSLKEVVENGSVPSREDVIKDMFSKMTPSYNPLNISEVSNYNKDNSKE